MYKLYNDNLTLISPCQYGFRSNISTSHGCLEMVEKIATSPNNNKFAIGKYINLKIAFDTATHDILSGQYYNGIL